MFREADVRGNENRLLKGVIGKVGNFMVVEANSFFGSTSGSILNSAGYYNFDQTGVEFAGLRKFDVDTSKWTGEVGFDRANTLKSRGIILGAGAFQLGMGKMPDYKYEATDFEKFSESAMEVWCGAKNTQLLAENGDYAMAKVAGYNYGSVFVDVQVQA